MARSIAQGASSVGIQAEIVYIRDYTLLPCQGCMACMVPKQQGQCVLARKDHAHALLARIQTASCLFIVAPIYFYHVPAGFKALIDRGQALWAAQYDDNAHAPLPPPKRPAIVGLVAGRLHGAKLFEGSLLTLQYFLEPLGFTILEDCCLRGYDTPDALSKDPTACERLYTLGARLKI